MPTSPRLALAATIIAAALLAGCARQPTTRPEAPSTRAATRAPAPPAPTTTSTNTNTNTSNASDEDQSERTGIRACDDYLSSYLACHRAAQIFPPDQLQYRYEAMRTSLLRDSKNPDIRPQLAERCNSLARSLRQALHGKSCATSPAPTASSP
jgi:hypothetical protein